MRLDGDWADYALGMKKVAERYRPASMIELGCGFFVALKAVSEILPQLTSYIGVDVRPNERRWQEMPGSYPQNYFVLQADVHGLEIRHAKADLVLLDAHVGSAEQYGLDTSRQCELADRINTPVVVVDDCRIGAVAKETAFFWGPPTWKANEVTGLWVWER